MRKINISVLGTGIMGPEIAKLCAKAGLSVKIYGRSHESLNKGFDSIKLVKSLKEAVENADLIIECLPENVELKQKIFKELDELCKPDVILTSCTSGIMPTIIAKYTKHPERIAAAHFWNPPQLIPLVEVVPGERTSMETVAKTVEWVKYIGGKAIVMEKECPGFIGNRLQHAMLREAFYMIEKGFAKPEEIDKAVEYGFGRRLPVSGPICTADLAGLDSIYSVSKYLLKELCNSDEPSELIIEKVESGELGSKSGQGFYKWDAETLEKKQQERAELLLHFLKKEK